MNSKRKRVIFQEAEKTVLLDQIQKYSSTVENKKTDGASAAKKLEAWAEILETFNLSPLVKNKAESIQTIKKLWSNMKAREKAREEQTRLNQKHVTGGGPSSPDINPESSQILRTISKILPAIKVLDSDSLTSLDGDNDDHVCTRRPNKTIDDIKKEILKQDLRQRNEMHALQLKKLNLELEQANSLHKLKLEHLKKMQNIEEIEMKLKIENLKKTMHKETK